MLRNKDSHIKLNNFDAKEEMSSISTILNPCLLEVFNLLVVPSEMRSTLKHTINISPFVLTLTYKVCSHKDE